MKPYYDHAGISIYHGDCREVLPEMEPVDCVVTDPPYGLGIAAQLYTGGRKRMERADWDASTFTDIGMLLALGRLQVIWGGIYYPLPPSRGWLCWYKPDAPPSMAQCEFAWSNRDANARFISHSIAATNGEREAHPTQKPTAVMRWTLQETAADFSCIVDPFCGSGTTLVAAKHLGKSAIGIEIEEKYCEIAAKRLSQEVFTWG